MTSIPHGRLWTLDEYFEHERVSAVKHEFLRGEVLAMSGGTIDHATIGGNLHTLLKVQLRGKPCRPFNSDAKVYVPSEQFVCYPDVSVVCGPVEKTAKGDALMNPTLVIEVLSPSTESYNRTKKFNRYRSIPTLREIVLVASQMKWIERYHFNGTLWVSELGIDHGQVHLSSIGLDLDVEDIYEDVEFAVE